MIRMKTQSKLSKRGATIRRPVHRVFREFLLANKLTYLGLPSTMRFVESFARAEWRRKASFRAVPAPLDRREGEWTMVAVSDDVRDRIAPWIQERYGSWNGFIADVAAGNWERKP